jgi:hypothetical protein
MLLRCESLEPPSAGPLVFQKADYWDRRLLCPRRERPRRRRAAEKANELTSPHIRTQA